MSTSRSILFQLCLTLVVCFGSHTCKPLSSDIENEDLGKFYRLSEDLLGEEDTKSKMENFWKTIKEVFLRQLHLSAVPREYTRIPPPQFMVELYNKYVSNSSAVPQYDVIRSFMIQDTVSVLTGTKSKHRLKFSVNIPNHEEIITAELQLLFFPDARSKFTSQSFKVQVKVYEANENNFISPIHWLNDKEVVISQSTWVTFDVTTAVQSWVKRGQAATAFDVVVDRKNCIIYNKEEEEASCLNMSLSVGDNTSVALLVFLNDYGSRRKEAKKELKEKIIHEEETFYMGADWDKENKLPNQIHDAQHSQRIKRKADLEYCHRTSLKVSFKDIGWDSWIVAPPEYDAFECQGLCYHPLTDESTPSRHALIQALMNLRDPKKANMACCVPIKLEPITVMYQENGHLTIRYLYEEMKVAECGCR